MIAGQELGLVNQDAMELPLLQLFADLDEQVDVRPVGVRSCVERDPGTDRPDSRTVVEIGGPKHGFHAALALVELGLEQGGRFPRVHRGIVEI
jgi:hypothetical protein